MQNEKYTNDLLTRCKLGRLAMESNLFLGVYRVPLTTCVDTVLAAMFAFSILFMSVPNERALCNIQRS